jgi:hypothetical protein
VQCASPRLARARQCFDSADRPVPPRLTLTLPIHLPAPPPADFLTQYFNRDRSQPYRHDLRKTAAMAAAGAAVAAPLGLGLYRWMDAVWPSAALAVAAGKFTLDQIVGCFIWQAAYCSLPGNDWYRDMLAGLARGAAGGVDAGMRDAASYAAAVSAMVAPAAC